MNRIILVGPGASGKDFLKRKLELKGFKTSISFTTRPPRPGEEHGKDYYFITEDAFTEMIGEGEFREWNKFADKWYYGTRWVEFESAGLFVMTPSGIAAMTPDERKESWVIYLDIPEDVRRERLNKRKDADNTERRIQTDRDDFKNFTDYDTIIRNEDF
jgi:guanylate kinase